MPFVAEILDRLIVEQRIDIARVRLGVGFVLGAVEAQAPLGDRKRERDVYRQRRQRDDGETPVVAHNQYAADKRNFEQRRQDRIDGPIEQIRHRSHAALEIARDAAGAPIEVKAQAQRMQMREHTQRDLARGAREHARKHDRAQFLEQRS